MIVLNPNASANLNATKNQKEKEYFVQSIKTQILQCPSTEKSEAKISLTLHHTNLTVRIELVEQNGYCSLSCQECGHVLLSGMHQTYIPYSYAQACPKGNTR